MSGLFAELKRRNVFRVAIAYVVVAWLALQVIDILMPMLALPEWVSKFFLLIIIVGFPFAILLAWAFELTPDGLKRDKDVDRSESITPQTGRALDRITIIVLVLAVGFLMADKFMLQDPDDEMSPETSVDETASEPPDLSIAVLPFVNMSGDKDNEYFADGLSEELLNKLTRVPDLKVTGRTSSFAYKGQSPNLQDVGKTLGVANILEGSVRRQGDEVRITAQLVRAADGFHLWSDTYDRTLDDVFAIQDEIAQAVTDSLDIVLDNTAMRRMRNSGVREVDAFIEYQKGLELYELAHGNEDLMDTLKRAKAHFDEAVRLAPDFASAYFIGTDYYAHILFSFDLPLQDRVDALTQLHARLDAAYELAQDLLRRAVIDVDRSFFSNDWKTFPDKLDRANALDGCAEPVWYEVINVTGRRAKQAGETFRRLLACDPLNMLRNVSIADNLLWTGKPDEAVAFIETVRQHFDQHAWIDNVYTKTLGAVGRHDEAIEVARKVDIPDVFLSSLHVSALAAAGRLDEARHEAGKFLQERGDPSASAVATYAVIGDRENANRSARYIDEQPGGSAMLLSITYGCYCGAPFDIEQTPNFKAQMDAAGFPWPPTSILTIPAKDW